MDVVLPMLYTLVGFTEVDKVLEVTRGDSCACARACQVVECGPRLRVTRLRVVVVLRHLAPDLAACPPLRIPTGDAHTFLHYNRHFCLFVLSLSCSLLGYLLCAAPWNVAPPMSRPYEPAHAHLLLLATLTYMHNQLNFFL